MPHLVVVNTKLATYHSILTVTGRHEGLYECHVSNDRGSLSAPEAFLVRGKLKCTLIIMSNLITINMFKTMSCFLGFFFCYIDQKCPSNNVTFLSLLEMISYLLPSEENISDHYFLVTAVS